MFVHTKLERLTQINQWFERSKVICNHVRRWREEGEEEVEGEWGEGGCSCTLQFELNLWSMHRPVPFFFLSFFTCISQHPRTRSLTSWALLYIWWLDKKQWIFTSYGTELLSITACHWLLQHINLKRVQSIPKSSRHPGSLVNITNVFSL